MLTEAIEALIECGNACTQCADACLSETDVQSMVKCIRLDLDCADICFAEIQAFRQSGASRQALMGMLLEPFSH